MDAKQLFVFMTTKNKYIVVHFLFSTFYNDGRVNSYYEYLKRNNIETYVVSIGDSKKQKNVLSCNFVDKYQGKNLLRYIQLFISFSKFAIRELNKLIKKNPEKYFILHFHNMPNIIILLSAPFKFKNKRVKVILDNHDLLPLVVKEKFNFPPLNFIARMEQYFSFKYANKLICADHNQLEYIVKSGIKKDKITPILNVANPEIFINDSYLENKKTFDLVYHGTISKRLGIDIILEALSKVKGEEQIKFNIIGEGDYLEKIKNKIKELNLTTKVVLKDKFVSIKQLPKILSGMDVGIIGNRQTLLSDYMLPVKLLEYIYLEKPVIAPRNAIISKYFNEEMICFYNTENSDEMAERILFLFRNKEARVKYSKNALKFVDKYNFYTEMAKYQKLINELLAA